MPPAQPDGAADDDRLRTYQPNKAGWVQLPSLLAKMFPSIQTMTEFLEQELQVPSGRIPGFDRTDTPEQYWRTVLSAADRDELVEAFYHRLYLAMRRRREYGERLDLIFGNHPWTDPLTSMAAVAAFRQKGCHIIVWTRDALVRERVREWLEAEGFEPELVWSNREMTSFEVNETDDEQVRTLINSRWKRVLVKVIPSGQPDELLDLLRICDEARELAVPELPIQLTVAEIGAAAARFHLAALSAMTRTVGGRRRAETATHIGDGMTQEVPLEGTLLQWGFGDDHKVTIKAVKYAKIRVVFVGASPRCDDGGLGEGRVKSELEAIRRMARLGHITLAGDFTHATREQLPMIMDKEPDILHIACRGQDGRLYWEDDDGDPDDIHADWLIDCIIARAGHRLGGIVLTACDGESTGSLLTKAARVVVVREGRLSDDRGPHFAEKLYDELTRMPVLRTAASLAAQRARVRDSVLVFPPQAKGEW